MSQSISRLGFALIAASFLFSAGCSSKPATGVVVGSVSSKGQPVTEGEVHFFMAEKGVGAVAQIDASGTYKLNAPLPAGTYTVAIVPPPPQPVDPKKGGPPPAPSTSIPAKYQAPDTSGLTFTVQKGNNEFPIVIVD